MKRYWYLVPSQRMSCPSLSAREGLWLKLPRWRSDSEKPFLEPAPGFRIGVLLLAVGLLTVGGCGGTTLVDVKGKVYYGDQPLKSTGLDQAFVQFHKQGEKSDTATYQGNFDEEGNFSLQAPPGKYKVLVIATKSPKAKEGKGGINYGIPETVIPKVYSSPTTDKVVEVSADSKPGDFDIRLSKSK